MKTYRVNETFLSLQGEGHRAGSLNVFVRFSGCNLACDVEPGPRSPGGFACDTEFASGVDVTAEDLHADCCRLWADATGTLEGKAVIFTGGEPGLQLDTPLLRLFRDGGWFVAVETNGSILLPLDPDPRGGHVCEADDRGCFTLFNWIAVSPKVAEHAVKQRVADEVRYVRGRGQGIPRPVVSAKHLFLSPAFMGDQIDREALAWCVDLVLHNPAWRLSVQQHKLWRLR